MEKTEKEHSLSVYIDIGTLFWLFSRQWHRDRYTVFFRHTDGNRKKLSCRWEIYQWPAQCSLLALHVTHTCTHSCLYNHQPHSAFDNQTELCLHTHSSCLSSSKINKSQCLVLKRPENCGFVAQVFVWMKAELLTLFIGCSLLLPTRWLTLWSGHRGANMAAKCPLSVVANNELLCVKPSYQSKLPQCLCLPENLTRTLPLCKLISYHH